MPSSKAIKTLASDARALAGSAGRVCLWTGIGIGVAGLVVVLIAKGNVRIEQARWRKRKATKGHQFA